MKFHKKVLITLVSLSQAKEGYIFIHKGATPKCERCNYVRVCIQNLEVGRVYKVVGLREKTLYCHLSEENMRVVEVVESEIESSILSRQAIEGVIILFQPPECDLEDCENFNLCFPRGLSKGDRCEIVKVIGGLQCQRDLLLSHVLLRRSPAF